MIQILLMSVVLLATTFGSYSATTHYALQGEDTFGALSPFTSAQLSAGADNGECLTTNGTVNAWGSCGTGGGGSFPFSADSNYGQVVYSTSTPTLWFKSGVFASSTSRFVFASTTAINATSICLDGDSCRTTWPTAGSNAFEVATTADIAVPNLAYFTKTGGRTTLGSVATGTLTASSPLSLTGVAVLAGTSRTLSLDTSGVWSGTAGALAGNGGNCSAGSFPLGVDTLGAVETCTDAWTEAENTTAAYAAQATTLTIAGTANQLTSSAGAQSLAANRTWTLSLPNHVIFPGNFQATNSTTTNATTTSLHVLGQVDIDGLTSALVLAGAGGILGEYAGIDCTNQFVRDVDAAGAGTCATVGASDVSLANLTATDSTLTFSGTYTGATARTIGLNLGNANTWTALQQFGNATSTLFSATYASSTDQVIGRNLTFGGVTADTWPEFCATITGGADLCDGSDATAAGAANPFTWAASYATTSAATTSPLWLQGNAISLMASGTAMFGAGGVGSSSIQLGGDQTAWTVGNFGVDNSFRIASATSLSLNGALIIDKALKTTLLQASTTDVSANTAAFGGTATTSVSAAGNLRVGGTAVVIGQTTLATSLSGFAITTSGVVSAVAAGGTDHIIYSSAANAPASEAAFLYTAASDRLTVVHASTTVVSSLNSAYFATTGGTQRVGIGATTTPWALLSVNSGALAGNMPQFAIGSSTKTDFLVAASGYVGLATTSPWARLTLDRTNLASGFASSSIVVTEFKVSTTTNKILDARDSNSHLFQIGASATTITLTGFLPGMQMKVVVCNPSNVAAGAITWATSPAALLLWPGGTVPTQTTTATKCDVYSFIGTQATSSVTSNPGSLGKIFGAQTANF